MEIRKAALADVAEIMEIYAGARRFMVENGNPDQWASRNWPPEELIRENISDGSLYVLAGDEQDPADIAAVFCMEYGEHAEPCYDEIEGSWLDDSPYAVIHHIASSAQGRGAGRRCLDWAYENTVMSDSILMRTTKLCRLSSPRTGLVTAELSISETGN